MKNEDELFENVIKKYYGENIRKYSLISNWGYTFSIDGITYDARFMANCYGVALNCFQVYAPNGNKKIAQSIENELNKVGNFKPKTFWNYI